MKKIALITGGAGFIGSNLVDELLNDGHEVIVIDNESADFNDKFYWNEKAHNYKNDICDYHECSIIFERHKPDVVFHVAAEARIQPSINNPLKAIETNVIGTGTILELCKQNNVKRVIYSSTSSAYGLKNTPPLNENMPNDCLNQYSISKTCGEELCKLYYKLYGLETIILRYFNVYGERQPLKGKYAPVVGLFLRQYKANEPMTIVGDGEQRRDFTHVSDIVAANILVAKFSGKNYNWGQLYNVGTGKNYSINEIAKLIGDNTINIPTRPAESRITLANIEKIKNDFGWKPKISLENWIVKNI